MKCDTCQQCRNNSYCREHSKIKELCILNGWKAFSPKTNYDLIVSKTPAELACWISEILMYCTNMVQMGKTVCSMNCPLYQCCNDQPTDNIEEWLLSPANKETKE